MKQKSFADLSWERKEKRTRREEFLSEMEGVIPWKEFEGTIRPLAPRAVPSEVGGRPAHPVGIMLRVYFCQNWYQLSDEAAEDALYDSESVRRFCLGTGAIENIPDASSICRFRHLLEEHRLQEKLFAKTTKLLSSKGIITKSGTIVDATIIHAPSSTKNESKSRDPEMSQTKKGNQWYFGMKSHIGVDALSGVVHTVKASTAKESDLQHARSLLHGGEETVLADRAYCSSELADALKREGAQLLTPTKKPRGAELSKSQKLKNKKLSSRRAIGEHPFHVVKVIFGYRKTRYRGLFKNYLHQLGLFLLANLYRLRHHPLLHSA